MTSPQDALSRHDSTPSALPAHRILSIQGCLSAFCDATFRIEMIWSIEKLYNLFFDWLDSRPEAALSRRDLLDPEVALFCRSYLAKRLSTYELHPVPLVIQDAYTYQGKDVIADIRYGWDISKGTGQRIAKRNLPPIPYAFTVAHADDYIPFSGVCRNLMDLLERVSKSHLERLFYSAWYSRYYSPTAPALLPEIHRFSLASDACGQRTFTYSLTPGFFRRGRLDFLVYNARAGVASFIELDGHTSHNQNDQRRADSFKRNVCAKAKIPLHVFTSDEILHSIDAVMDSLDYLFSTPA